MNVFGASLFATTPIRSNINLYIRYHAITDGNQVGTVEQAGTHNMFQKDMELLNNSETDMISVCLRGALK